MRLLLTIALVCVVRSVAFADYLEVRRTALLKENPEREAEMVVRLEPPMNLQLLDGGQQENGYYRAALADGSQEGWVYRTFVRRRPGSIPGTVASSGSGPCAVDLASCGDNGCAPLGSEHALMNAMKRHDPSGRPLVPLTFAQFRTLQRRVEDLGIEMGKGSHLTQEDRERLKDLDAGNGTTAGEGDFVQLVGFLAEERNIRPAGPESVNCRLKGGFANNDVHLPLVQRESETEYDSVVVEPIPQNRPAAWTIALFKRLQSERRLIMVRGNLFFDNQHRVRDDPEEEEGLGSEPKRFSLWEIHPVTQLFECQSASNSCDPMNLGQWREIR